MLANFLRICIRWRYLAKLKGSDYWETIPMTDRRVMDEGTPALAAKTPEDKIQRKEAILRRNFCVYVQKMHQDKNGPFLTEYQVLWAFAILAGVGSGTYVHTRLQVEESTNKYR